jgi:hypothetical protein
MRSPRSLLLGLFGAVALATGALADNGLQRFERELKPQLELQKLSYRDAEALGDQGFVLKDVVAVLPPNPQTGDKPSTIRIDKVTVDAIDFDRLKKDNKEDLPRFMKLKLEGLTGDDAATNSLSAYGLQSVPADVVLDYRLDGAAKRLTLQKLEIVLRGQGRVSLSLVIDGIDDKMSAMEDTKESGRLQSASLTIDDKGIVAHILDATAKSQGSTPDGLVALGLMTIQALAGQQDAESMKAFDAVASFMGDWRAPNGPITLTVTPAKGASFSDMGSLMAPNALRTVLGLEVTYPGTRAGAATGAK